ncbi:hypothetical protein LTR93_012105, partial [Exophiala xenobiotica]
VALEKPSQCEDFGTRESRRFSQEPGPGEDGLQEGVSSQDGRVGFGVAYLGLQAHRMVSKTLGSTTSIKVHHGELVALYEACRVVDQRWPDQDTNPRTPVRILSSSRSALEMLAKPRQQAGRAGSVPGCKSDEIHVPPALIIFDKIRPPDAGIWIRPS